MSDTSSQNNPSEDSSSPYAVLKNRDFIQYISSRFIASFAQQMLAVAVGWEVYERTNSKMALGLVGLAQVAPMFFFTFHAGHVADNHSRKKVIFWMMLLVGVSCAGLTLNSYFNGKVDWTYASLLLFGAARTYLWAASASFMPQLVSREQFSKAVTFNTGTYQVASVTGPAAGGALIALTGSAVSIYAINVIAAIACAILTATLRIKHTAPSKEPMTLKSVVVGLNFVYHNKVVLGCITLDMFAVLLGGATALLPVYCKDILHTGPNGLGWLQAALPIGSLMMSFILLHSPPMQQAGKALLWSVAGFGLATIIFGLSRWFWLSFFMLFLCGVTDYISVVVRHTLVQLKTPDAMRGRVSAVNSLFIGTSNQLGEFESGFVAQFAGTVFAAVSGGVGTIVVVVIAAWLWPEIREYGKLDS